MMLARMFEKYQIPNPKLVIYGFRRFVVVSDVCNTKPKIREGKKSVRKRNEAWGERKEVKGSLRKA
jgi:hypothetical protein